MIRNIYFLIFLAVENHVRFSDNSTILIQIAAFDAAICCNTLKAAEIGKKDSVLVQKQANLHAYFKYICCTSVT